MRQVLIGAGWLVASFLSPAPANPCSCMGVEGGFLVGGQVVYPRNAIGVPWWGELEWKDGSFVPPSAEKFTVEQWKGSSWKAVPFELVRREDEMIGRYHRSGEASVLYLVHPSAGFKPHSRYRFTFAGRGRFIRRDGKPVLDRSMLETIVDVSPDPCLASSGHASVEALDHSYGEVTTSTLAGSCATTILGDRAAIKMNLSPDWAKWSDALLFTVKVHGIGFWRPDKSLCTPTPPGTSWTGRGQELLYTACGEPNHGTMISGAPEASLPSGTFDVDYIAWLPGTAEQLVASTKVTLGCSKN